MIGTAIVDTIATHYKNQGGLVDKVYKYSKPNTESDSEYCVVNTLDIPNKVFQQLIVNVNLHVQDINSSVPDSKRLSELEANALEVLDKVHLGEIDFYVQQTKVFQESSKNEHYLNVRLLVKIIK